jgi:drug/metabolite transporter (DMT)-like permease
MERYLSKISKPVQSYFYLALCILLWASIPVASKKILSELNNIQTLFYSTVFSFLVMGVILLFQGKFKTMKNYSIKDYIIMIFLGFLGNYLYYVLLYGALSLTSASEGFILAYTWPILVLILAFIILRERLTFQKAIAIAISFSGIIVIVTQGKILSLNFTSIVGDIMAISGAFVFALFSILGKRFNFDKTISVFIYFTSALIFVTLTCVFTSSIKLPSANVWMWLLYNGILVNGVSYIFWFKALEYGDTAIISNALYLTPFLSLVYISLFLNEKILFSSVAGLIIIVVGIIIQSININKPNPLK